MKHSFLALSALFAASLSTFAQQLVFDDFDRPNSTNLGPDWIEQNGNLAIEGNRGKGTQFLANDTWMSHTSFSQSYTDAKARVEFVAPGGELAGSVGVVLGLNSSTWEGTAVRIQDNDLDGLFDRVFFEAAVNAGAWYVGGAPVLFDLPTPLASGQLTAWITDGGDTAVARIEDSAGNLIDVYTASGILSSPFAPTGTEVGVWVRSRALFDDFYALEHRALDGYPASISLATGGVQTLDVSLGAARAGDFYFVLGSFTGTSPGLPLAGGLLLPLNFDSLTQQTIASPNIAPYLDSFGVLDSVGHARARLSLAPGLNPSFAGLTLNHSVVSFQLGGGVNFTAVTNPASVDLLP